MYLIIIHLEIIIKYIEEIILYVTEIINYRVSLSIYIHKYWESSLVYRYIYIYAKISSVRLIFLVDINLQENVNLNLM